MPGQPDKLARQLVWLVQAPSLLPCPDSCRDAGTLLQREYQHAPQLIQQAAERLADQPQPRRLGLLFEAWVAALIDAAPTLTLLGRNLPIRDDGTTLGELDMVVRDEHSGEIHHWELALKFYLATATQWYGPNSHDTLERKARHLFHSQLPRSDHPAAKRLLTERGWPLSGRVLLTRGRLFYHCDQPRQGQQPTADHERGWWLPSNALPNTHWQVLDRSDWPTPFMSDKSTSFIDTPTLIDYVESRSRPLMVLQVHHDTPGFVVPVSWPNP
ncbi:MAG: DUF1853 family protein [Pseudomonadales bacterium]|nr:DUF1853 family protein [Pseudomonadales bacterium]